MSKSKQPNLFLFDDCENKTRNKLTYSPSKLMRPKPNSAMSKIRSLSNSLDVNLQLKKPNVTNTKRTKKSFELKKYDDEIFNSNNNQINSFKSFTSHKKSYSINTNSNNINNNNNNFNTLTNSLNTFSNFNVKTENNNLLTTLNTLNSFTNTILHTNNNNNNDRYGNSYGNSYSNTNRNSHNRTLSNTLMMSQNKFTNNKVLTSARISDSFKSKINMLSSIATSLTNTNENNKFINF